MSIAHRTFMKLVHKVSDREMDSRSRPDMNITAEAEGALQEATEIVITIMMEMSNTAPSIRNVSP